ncbi:MAG: type II secretion system F family protein [Gemmatimonadaceae bacterium]
MTSFLSAWRRLDDARDKSVYYRSRLLAQSGGVSMPLPPRAWDEEIFERTLLVLGEESGTMENSLRLLADFYARKHRMMLAVRKRMTYPLFTGVCATFIAPLSLLFFGHVAAYVVTVTVGLALWLLAGGAIVTWAANRYGRQPAMVRARLARSLATAIEAGLPLGRSIHLAADASADPAVQAHVRAIPERVLASQPIERTLGACPHMTPEFLSVLHVMEQSGDASSLARLADLYEDGFR